MPPLKYLIRTVLQKMRFRLRGGSLPKIPSDLAGRPVILLVSETNVPRIERMVFHLQKAGRKETLVFLGSANKFKAEFFQRCSNIQHFTVDHAWQLEPLISQFRDIRLIHTFESRSIYAWHALKAAENKIPVIFDFQDLYTNYTGDRVLPAWLKENLWFEAQCLKHSDALISYSLEWIPARKNLSLPKKRVLYFPFYLDDQEIRDFRTKENNDEIHIVYAGGIAPVDKNISFNMTITEKFIRGSNVYLHVYPSPLSGDEVISSYFRYAEEHPNLVMHQPVNNNEMSAELNRYDFGIVPFFKTAEYQSADKYRYSSALKIFNYFEAGLPVIIAEDIDYQAWLVSHYRAGIVMKGGNSAELPVTLQRTEKNHFAEAIHSLQNKLKLSNNIDKISSLYNELINNK